MQQKFVKDGGRFDLSQTFAASMAYIYLYCYGEHGIAKVVVRDDHQAGN